MGSVPISLPSFEAGGVAVVIGASGGIGQALLAALKDSAAFEQVIGLSRHSIPALDLLDESQIKHCAEYIAQLGTPRLIIDATGVLHNERLQPEKSLQQIDAAQMRESFAVNAIGPALLMKYFLPRLPREGKAVFASLSAKVGSIGDNQLGGWYSYRASKAALNQLIHTAAIELRRRQPDAICVALHPGTVQTRLSSAFSKSGLEVQTPEIAAARLLAVVEQLLPAHSGGFFNHHGESLPW
ncbi:SDR family NAD(P)-dependent oxidoreductase [Undibacterium sp. Jales W-56]|uniref:SDR family NAD(P)-dependent oxidoreductase n=1 Tax=Undibacterium sp. Jales W-56 TaxID=2897325 RepID=UPI0021CE05B4|nr:SDR family NAD(P)-dependent oxidoreductase [Undibacterium sp. Jales W-56]MCU6433996.1 SDR family NAD(P)-dependent oxidoreductase [Undibacterium sp. Jales W-56]